MEFVSNMAAKRRMALFLVCLAAAASVGGCWDVEEAAERVKTEASDGIQDAKDKAGSWAEWAATKFTGGVSGGSDTAMDTTQKLVEKTEEAASKSTDTMNSAAFESSKLASEKAKNLAESTSGGLRNVKNYASDKAGEVVQN